MKASSIAKVHLLTVSTAKEDEGGSGGFPGVLFHFLRFGSPLSWEQRA